MSSETTNTNPDYVDIFEARGDLYNEAAEIAPHAREIERQMLIDLLDIQPDDVVCDAPAGGGYLADSIGALVADPTQVVCVEPSVTFAQKIDPTFTSHVAPLDALPLDDGSMDRVGSLAGLHHLRDKATFFAEAFRVLKPGGLVAIADVVVGTPSAEFLNGAVDRYTSTGHRGEFLNENECATLLSAVGFEQVAEEHRKFHWEFGSMDELVTYCKVLFGMVEATEEQVREEILAVFPVEKDGDLTRLPWSLAYGVGVKPA